MSTHNAIQHFVFLRKNVSDTIFFFLAKIKLNLKNNKPSMKKDKFKPILFALYFI